MAAMKTKAEPKFIIGTGDNFYWCGIMNSSDFQVEADWTKPYGAHNLLDYNWYNVLGNHEYGYNVEAQIELHAKMSTWYLPARYYTERIMLSSTEHMTMIFIDTSPCVSEYRATSPAGWDPCGTEYPTCSQKNPSDPNDHFEGKCMFHPNIIAQSCTTQLTWFEEQIKKVPETDWLVVVGHHPSDEIDVDDFTAVMLQRGISL